VTLHPSGTALPGIPYTPVEGNQGENPASFLKGTSGQSEYIAETGGGEDILGVEISDVIVLSRFSVLWLGRAETTAKMERISKRIVNIVNFEYSIECRHESIGKFSAPLISLCSFSLDMGTCRLDNASK
jgi:hypothetical protein